jgi:hypothetical protein
MRTELYTLKMIQKINVSYLEIYTCTSRQKNSPRSVSVDPSDFCCCCLRKMQLVLTMVTLQQRSWCVLQLSKRESVTDVKRAFRTQFHMEPAGRGKLCAKCTLHSCYRLSLLAAEHTNCSSVG